MAEVFQATIGDGGTSGTRQWDFTPGLLIPPGLVEGGGPAYLRRLRVNSIGDFDIQTDTDPNRAVAFSFSAGPHLTSQWENYEEAVTLTAGTAEFAIPGPNYSGFTRRDTAEPYSWSGPFSGPFRDRWNAYFAAYGALSQSDRDGTTLELRDGPKGADVVIDTAAQTVDSEGRVNLAATVTPLPGTTIVSRAWTATGGAFVNAAIEDAVWDAPFQRLGSGLVPYTLTLTVTDSNGNVTSAEVIMTVREVPVIDMAIGNSGKLEGIAVQGSGALVGMASGSTVVYRQRVGRATMVSRSTSTGTRSTQVSSRNTVTGTRNTSLGSHFTSTGSRSTQATSRSTSTGSRNTVYSSSNTSTGSRSTTPSRSTSLTRSTSGSRSTSVPLQRQTSTGDPRDPDRHLTVYGTGSRNTAAGSRNTVTGSRSTSAGSSRNTSTGSRSTSLSRSTSSSRNTAAGSRNTSTGSRGTSSGSRQTNILRSTEANARDTSTGSRNTTFTRITEV